METGRIRSLTLSEVEAIYVSRMAEDFPPAEIKPMSAIRTLLERGQYACYGYSGGDTLAYAFFVKLGRWALLDYYAVMRDHRDRGVGSRFLGELIAGPMQAFDCVLAEVDDPDFAGDARERALRERRKRFYLRNGLWETGVRASAFGVEFQLLALPVGARPDDQKVRRVYSDLYRSFLPAHMYDSKIRV
ncbi:MAG: GNAT family N-acetyltransferase [Clostridia bacterium]|nr:GNAT family N-acetyltransferase [Clostridia bacterium]